MKEKTIAYNYKCGIDSIAVFLKGENIKCQI